MRKEDYDTECGIIACLRYGDSDSDLDYQTSVAEGGSGIITPNY